MKRPVFLAAAAAAALLLGTCNNAINLVDELTDDVKIAKGLYLEVQTVSPTAGAIKVSPDAPITVVFDRTLDMESVTADSVVVSPSVGEGDAPLGVIFTQNEKTFTLSVNHSAYFKPNTEYTISIKTTVRGSDSSLLRDEYTWAFTPGEAPVGTIAITGGLTATNNVVIPLSCTWSGIVDKYKISLTEGGLGSYQDVPPPGTIDVSGQADGNITFYIRFQDEVTLTESPIYSVSIVLDRVAPTVDAGTPKYMNSTGTPTNPTMAITASDDRSGIASYAWADAGGTGFATFSNAAIPNPIVYNATATDAGIFAVQVTVTDKAGNSASDSVFINTDFTPPSPSPTVTGTSPTLDNTPTWSWSPGGDPTALNVFRYKLDSGAWITNTTATTYTPSSVLTDAIHTLHVQQRDEAGNWSAEGASPVGLLAIRVTPVLPYSGQTGVATTVTLEWRPISKVENYDLYIGTNPEVPFPSVSTGIKPYYALSGLAYYTRYYWFYVATVRGETVRFPSSGYYSFTTRLGKLP